MVSIVIPCWNQANWLPQAIESALNQTYKDIEVIVVNDGSPDNTSEVALQYPVVLVEKENGGLSSARNAGIKVAKGEYILPLDADDRIVPSMVETLIYLKTDIAACGIQEFGDSNQYHIPQTWLTLDAFKEWNRIGCCSLFKKEIWEVIGGYDENMKVGYEDWDFWYRALQHDYEIKTVNRPLFYYRKHGKSMIDNAVEKHEMIKNYILNK